MTNREELANRVIALRALRELITAEEASLRVELAEHFTLPGQREVGVINGHPAGNVQLIKGTSSWTIDNYDAWLAWVEKHHPDEIETTKGVRSSFTNAVMAKLRRGDPIVDEATGELIVPDGIAPKSSQPSLRVTPTKDAPVILLQAMGDLAVVLGLAVAGELEA